MPSLSELQQTAETGPNATLTQGLDDLSHFQMVTFTEYARKVLPLDGLVFWVKASVLSNGPSSKPDTVDVKGYLHLTTETIQNDEQLYDRNAVTFTAQADIDPFNSIGSNVLYIGEFLSIQSSFPCRTGLNGPANLHHYAGRATYPHMQSQTINSADDIDLSDVVASSLLPVRLGLSQFMSVFPAMLSTRNLSPPFTTIRCNNVSPTAGAFYIGERDSWYQLVSKDVMISTTDFRSAVVEDSLRYVQLCTLRENAEMGVTSIPVVQGERVIQNELNVIAMHKTVKFKADYYQQRMRSVVCGLILPVIPSIYPER